MRKFVEATGSREREHQSSRYKVISPKNILLGAIWERLLEETDQAQDHRVEMPVHHFRTPFWCIRDLRTQCTIIPPTFATFDVKVEVTVQEHVEGSFNRRFPPGRQ